MKAHIHRTIQKAGDYSDFIDQAYREGYIHSHETADAVVMVFETERTSAKLKEPVPQTSA